MTVAVESPLPHRFTVCEYMSLDLDVRTELIGGVIYDMSPRNEPHRYAVRTLNRLLVPKLTVGQVVQIQDAVAVSGWHGKDAPEIDVAVLADKAYDPIATAADAFAFIEVSDTTYRYDRDVKIPLYVQAGVPAWIVNIQAKQVEIYSNAADLELVHGQIRTITESFEILGIAIVVADLFIDKLPKSR